MKFTEVDNKQWKAVKEIYMEAFPKAERKPFFTLKHSVKSGKAKLFTATQGNELLGFVVAFADQEMVMVDYLAVSQKVRSRGTGSYLMQEICKYYAGKKIVLLIERLDDQAENKEQRVARRKFYLKNGFLSTDIFIEGASGNMEVLRFGDVVSKEEYMAIQKYALGKIFFALSRIQIVEK